MTDSVKTLNAITLSSIKTFNGIAAASVKTWNGITATATPVSGSYRSTGTDTGSGTSFTFSGKDIGTAASNRKVVVAVAYNSAPAISSMTIGGVSATVVGTSTKCEIWQANVPTGTTGDVVITFSGTNQRVGIGVWAVYAAASAASQVSTSTANPPSVTSHVIPTNGCCIAVAAIQDDSNTYTWSNLTEDYDAVISGGNDTHSGASTFSGYGTYTITATVSSGGNARGMVCASWAAA